MDYFIASEAKPHLVDLRNEIGSNAQWVSEAEVSCIMEEVKRPRAHSSINRAGVPSPRLATHRRGATFS